MPAELDSCVDKVMEQGHDESSAYAICQDALYGSSSSSIAYRAKYGIAMSQQIAAFPPKDGEDKKEEPKAEASFNETELGVITQFLTDAQDYLTADPNAPPELKEEAAKAFEIVYGKVNVAPEEEGPKPPA